MVNNGSTHYDHDRDGTHTTIGGCEVKFRNFNHDTYLTIRYENDKLTGKQTALVTMLEILKDLFLQSPMTWTTGEHGLHALPSRVSNCRLATT